MTTISDQVIKYKHGVLLDKSLNEFSDESYILDKKVVSVTCEGGYTNMNYIINLNLGRSSELVNTGSNILMNLLRRSDKLSN